MKTKSSSSSLVHHHQNLLTVLQGVNRRRRRRRHRPMVVRNLFRRLLHFRVEPIVRDGHVLALRVVLRPRLRPKDMCGILISRHHVFTE